MFENEKTVEVKNCKNCNSKFDITDKDLEFYEKVSPVFNGKKYNIPNPKLCPDCRQQRRLSFRNERKLYHRKCDLTGKQIISIYSPDKPYKVYDQNEWWSDKWDPLDYGIDFDFNKKFFEQFEKLLKKTPKINLNNHNQINSEYCNPVANMVNSYLCSNGNDGENCFYCSGFSKCINCIDCFNIADCELCYSCTQVNNSFNIYFSQNCDNCSNSYYLEECFGCSDCIFSVGLENKQYYVLNKPYTKEQYFKIKQDIFSNEKIFKECLNLYLNIKTPKKYLHIINSENSIGDYLTNTKNCKFIFDSKGCENMKYISFCRRESYNCFDVDYLVGSQFLYEQISSVDSIKIFFSSYCWYCNNIYYSNNCISCSNCFGCVGLRNKSYCILNRQYTKEEYEKLVPKIIEHMISIGEWGEFFPTYTSPFGYNETVANEYFPLSRQEAIRLGFKWSDYEKQNGYDGEFYEPLEIKNYNEKIVGKEIAEINIDKVLKGILKCEVTKKPFRIIKQELEFYRKHNLPIPRRHPDQRHLDRMKLRNPRKLFDRKCDKCGIDMKTTYSPEREEIVYCESCYNKEVY